MSTRQYLTPQSGTGSLDPTQPDDGAGKDGYVVVDAATRALASQYRTLVESDAVDWNVSYKLIKQIGTGGQGDVFLADRSGSFGVTFQVAIKFFRTSGYSSATEYQDEMHRQARVAMSLARIQQDHLLDIYNVVDFGGVHALTMEWVDGFDLRHLLTANSYDGVRRRVGRDQWAYLNDVIITATPGQPRLKPGIAIAILRECLAGVGALHRKGVVHADLKPANVMVKRTGNCKLIDFGSAFRMTERSRRPTWTPRYAAPEVLLGEEHMPIADLASLGYVLFEMLTGIYPFSEADDGNELVEAKRQLPDRLEEFLPPEVLDNGTLVHLLHKLIAPNPADRFQSAEDADLDENGAADFQRQLVKGDLSSEYENEIRLWLKELK